jgi:SAM-dependent methyltransferase
VAPRPTVLTPAERERVLGLIDELMAPRVDAESGAAIRAKIDEQLEWLGESLLGGVNPQRMDGDHAYTDARWQALAPTMNCGAVHLELGTEDAFGDDRVHALRDQQGLSEFLRLDFDAGHRPDVVADVTALPFASSSIDRIESASVFEHVAYPHRTLAESFRVLRPGGVMVVEMPFIFSEHGVPHDYVRLTPQFFERVCVETGFVDIVYDRDLCHGLYNTLHMSSKAALVDEARPEHEAMAAVHEAVVTLLGALIPADRWFRHSARHWYHSVLVVARKPGAYEPRGRVRDDARPVVDRIADLLADPQTKAPLRRQGDRLVCDFTGVGYAVVDGMAIFTEPRQFEPAKPALTDRVRRAAGAARRRAAG